MLFNWLSWSLVSFQTSAFTNVGFAQTLNLKNASSVNDTWWNSTVASDINAAISSRFLTALTIIERSVPLLPFMNRKTRKSSPDDAADFDNFKKSLSSQIGFHYSSSEDAEMHHHIYMYMHGYRWIYKH